jgi:hypothetical protein
MTNNSPIKQYQVVPLIGAGPVRLGMTRDEVRRAMPGNCESFRKGLDPGLEIDSWHESGFQVFYAESAPVVEYIELSRDSSFVATYNGVDVFELPADDVVAHVCRAAPFDLDNSEHGYSFIFPKLQMSLWRPTMPESPEDEEGRVFETIGIGVAGYYDE